MSFDEEYARWLQHQYDTDFGTSICNAECDLFRSILTVLVRDHMNVNRESR